MRQQIFSRLLFVSQADYSVDAILCMINPDTSVLSVISSLLTIFGIGSNGIGFLPSNTTSTVESLAVISQSTLFPCPCSVTSATELGDEIFAALIFIRYGKRMIIVPNRYLYTRLLSVIDPIYLSTLGIGVIFYLFTLDIWADS